MFKQMLSSEWRYFTRQPSFYVAASIFFSIAVFVTGFEKMLSDFGGNIHINGPYFITQVLAMFSIGALFLVVNFIGNTALKDHSSNMAELLYCKPFNPLEYQLGRFFGAYAAIVTVFATVPLGLFVGSLMPWVAVERLGEYQVSHYLNGLLFISLPTLLVFSALFYAVAMKLKSMMGIYISVIVVFVLYGVSESMFMSYRELAALMDPFAERTFAEISRYWTTSEKNNLSLPLNELLLTNRLIWIALALVVMLAFSGLTQPLSIHIRQKKSKKSATGQTSNIAHSLLSNKVDYRGQSQAFIAQLLARTFFEVKQVIISRAFIILCTAVFLMMFAILFQPKGMFNTTQLPYTQIMVQVINGSMKLLSTIIIIYYCAEVVWRERQANIADIIDAMPVANITFWLSKLFAVWLVLLLLTCFAMTVTMSFQLANGFNQLDITQYIIGLFYFKALPWMMLTVLAFFLQVISPNKFVGMFLFVLFLISDLAMEPLGLGHNMWRFSHSPTLVYSDFNGFAWALESHLWYMLYWGALSLIIAILGYALWQRGAVTPLKHRIKQLSYQLQPKGQVAIALSALVFVLSGSLIHYNTTILSQYQTTQEKAADKAAYEKQFSQYENSAIPMLQSLDINLEFYPKQRKLIANAEIEVVNKTEQPIKRFLLSLPYYSAAEFNFELTGGELQAEKHVLNSQWFEFHSALQPGEKRKGSFHIVRQHQGFNDDNKGRSKVDIVENGSFFEGGAMFPIFGYHSSLQLVDQAERSRYQLPAVKPMAKLEDKSQYHQNSLGADIGLIDFAATLSTTADQTAIAPGKLVEKWQQNGRNYFRYESEAPMDYFVSFMSGRYQLLTEKHKGVDIEIFFHPQHQHNVHRMQQAVKDSLDYFSESFGPYPHKQARIIEFPGYDNFAQSFPTTIAYSERIGFITDLRNPNELDKTYYVTAHEMAHQWWGNQVGAANVQGSTMLVETLAQYSALMLFKRKYGEVKLRRVIKLELDRYLRGRAGERVAEQPLMRVENQQYIHYNKGSVVMMALVDLMGESKVNQILKAFVTKYRYQDSPYPTSADLLKMIKQQATEQEQDFIDSLFAEITLYDLKIISASTEQLANGQFQVQLVINAKKVKADGNGIESDIALAEPIDIGLFVHDPNDISLDTSETTALYLQKHLIKSGENRISLTLPQRPQYAGIDPYIKLIDRDSDDNLLKL